MPIKPETATRRFWSRFVDEGECRVWTGKVANTGYGKVRFNGVDCSTHRLAWILANGPIPYGLYVLHTCDNKRCSKLEHLYLGTQIENGRDASVRLRFPRRDGEWAHNLKLSDADVAEIRKRNDTAQNLAARYGVHWVYIYQLWRGQGRMPTDYARRMESA